MYNLTLLSTVLFLHWVCIEISSVERNPHSQIYMSECQTGDLTSSVANGHARALIFLMGTTQKSQNHRDFTRYFLIRNSGGMGTRNYGFRVPAVQWSNEFKALRNFEKSSNLAQICQNMMKSFVQLAINPFFG